MVPRGYAIVIGVSKYRNLPAQSNLLYAEKDAENVYAALLSQQGGNVEFPNVKKLIGPDATLDHVRDALENWLPARAQPSDRVIVYFVGHGVVFINDLDPHATAEGKPQSEVDWKMVKTHVCRGASIGSGAVILAGITIGEGALVGAGAVVTRDVPPGAVVAGSPARFLRMRRRPGGEDGQDAQPAR